MNLTSFIYTYLLQSNVKGKYGCTEGLSNDCFPFM